MKESKKKKNEGGIKGEGNERGLKTDLGIGQMSESGGRSG